MADPKRKVVWDDEPGAVEWDESTSTPEAAPLPADSPLLMHVSPEIPAEPRGGLPHVEVPDAPPAPPPAPVANDKTSGAAALGRGAMQGASMGFADEVSGLSAALLGESPPRLEGRSFDSPVMDPLRARIESAAARYADVRDLEREANKKAEADTQFDKSGMNPVLDAITPDSMFGAGELTGAAVTAAAPVGNAGRGLSLVPRLKAAAKTGAALGGAAGFGSAEGDAVDQAIQTGTGAAAGALLAPVAGEVGRGVGKASGAASREMRAFVDRVLGKPAQREVMYGTPEVARQAEAFAAPDEAGQAMRAQATAGGDASTVRRHELGVEGRAREIQRLSEAMSTDPEALTAVDRLSGGENARKMALGSDESALQAAMLADPASEQGKRVRALARAGADERALDARSNDITSKIDELWQHGDVIKWEEDIASKGDVVKALVGRDEVPSGGLTKADEAYRAARAEWDQLRADVGDGEGSAAIKRLQREAWDAYENRLKRAGAELGSADPVLGRADYIAERFMALDDLKRHLQKSIALKSNPHREFMMERLEAPLRLNLEDANSWGAGPAALQKVRNAGWTRRLRTASGSPEGAFLAEGVFGEAASDPYMTTRAGDRGKVKGILKGAGTLEGDTNTRKLLDWADREAGLMEALTGHEGADPALVQRAQRARALSNEIRDAIGQRATEARAARVVEQMSAAPDPSVLPPIEMAGRVKPVSFRDRIAAVQRAEGIGAPATPSPLIEIAPPSAPPRVAMGGQSFTRADAGPLEQWAEQEVTAMRAVYGSNHPNTQKAEAVLRELKGGFDTRAAEARAADNLARVAQVEQPIGPIREALESTPTIGALARRFRPMAAPGQRAQRMAQLERVLKENPGNPEALAELDSLVPGGMPESRGTSTALGGARTTGAASGRSAPSGGMATAASRDDESQDDPVYAQGAMVGATRNRIGDDGEALVNKMVGEPKTEDARQTENTTLQEQMRDVLKVNPEALGKFGPLLATSSPDDFAVKHAALMATDQDYRQQIKRLSEKDTEGGAEPQ